MRLAPTRARTALLFSLIIVLGVGVPAYYAGTKNSRAIAFHKARLQPSGENLDRGADEEALIKLGWLVRRDVHLRHQTVKTNAAREFYEVCWRMGVELKEPVFFSIFRPAEEKPADIWFTAFSEDVPLVEKVLAKWESEAPQ
jgi:hypothetical protein